MKFSKKALSLFAVVAMLVSMMSVMTVGVHAESTNLLVNGDFENGIANWDNHFGNTNTTASATFHTGAGGAVSKGWNGNPTYQTVAVTPGTTYTVTFWVKGGGVGTAAGVVEGSYSNSAALYYFLGNDPNPMAGKDITLLGMNSATAAYGDWTKVKFDVTPATSSMTLGFLNGGNGSYAWFDDISIKEYVPVVPEIKNGDFENGIANWSNHFGNTNTTASTTFHTGAGGAVSKGWNGNPTYQTVDVTPGTTYTVTYWVKGGGVGTAAGVVEGSYSNSAALYYFLGNDPDPMAGKDITLLGMNYATAAYGDWTKVKFNVTPATSSMTFGFLNGGNGSWAWFDDISIKEYVPVVAEIKNGDFEDGLNDWPTHFGNGNWEGYAAGEENNVARSKDWNGDPMYQVIEVEPGTTYTIGASMLQGTKGSGMIVIEGAGKTTSQLSAAAYYYFGGNMDSFSATLLGSYILEAPVADGVTAEIAVTPTQDTIMIAFANPGEAYFYVDNAFIEVHEHSYVNDGCDKYCRVCGELTNPDAAHAVTYVPAAPATCYENGNVEYWFCEACDQVWLDEACTLSTNLEAVVLPMGHPEATHVPAKDATCYEDGNIEYWFCADCGQAWLDEACTLNTNLKAVILPMTDCDGVATCTEAGVCSMCGEITAYATGHSIVDGICTECGLSAEWIVTEKGTSFYLDGALVKELVKIDDEYYYFSTGDGHMLTDTTIWVGENPYGMDETHHRLGADGKLIKPRDGFITNDKNQTFYYIDDVRQTGLFEVDGEYYYFSTGDGHMLSDIAIWVKADNPYGLAAGNYYLGADGKIVKDGFGYDANGKVVYFSNYQVVKGLYEIDGKFYYFATGTGAMVTNKTVWIGANNGYGLTAYHYVVGADGVIALF